MLRQSLARPRNCSSPPAIDATPYLPDWAKSDRPVSSVILAATSAQLATELETNTILQTDKQVRIFCLIVKGDIDEEFNPKAMRQDWEQVQALARDLGDTKWQYRSLAELGMAAFYKLPENRPPVDVL